MSDIPFDEVNDNLPCPDCGQDDCVCDPDYDADEIDAEYDDELEEEDES